MKRTIIILILSLVGITSAQAFQDKNVETGKDVLKLMQNQYKDTWYKHLTFTQETIFYGAGERIERTQTWYEAMSLPGKLAIKFDDKASGNGILFNDGVQHGYANGMKIQEMNRVHDMLVLGFDVYHQSVDKTAEQLETYGYDLSKTYVDEWQGRSVYVVGVDKPDSTKAQFWIDQERLVYVRSLTIGRQNTIQEVRFNKYQKIGEAWIAPEVVILINGMKGLEERYTEIDTPDTLNPLIFDPASFVEADWDPAD
ncbi:hypothetical protein [Balneola vulgaris]|uniref:hypothetical protein n=1 Tax=Balneola vulgaris TaxID=287535 RepID=UPI0003797C25|nr:hypothetical protein [Balneola vulgaris]